VKPLRIGIVGYDDVQALDLVGPADAFTVANNVGANGHSPKPRYELIILGLTTKPFRSESGIRFHPDVCLGKAPALDTLIVPGGRSLRQSRVSEPIAAWIQHRAPNVRRIASVCTGIYGLAPTGLLDGRSVTTHWRFAADVARRFPRLNVHDNALFLRDGAFYTAGGITASVDLALSLIQEDYDASLALAVARELVVYLKRSGGQSQYSEPLRFQSNVNDRFAELASWMHEHLANDLSLEALARQVCLSPRQCARRFKQAFGATPAIFVESLRIEEARRRLTERSQTIETIAASVGFHSDDVFRRAFQRRFGVKPSSYRDRFNAGAQPISKNSFRSAKKRTKRSFTS